MRALQQSYLRGLLIPAAVLVAPFKICQAQRAAISAAASQSFTILPANEVAEVRVRSVRSIALGDSRDNRPSAARDVLMLHNRIFVLDGMQRSLLVYDQGGKFLKRATESGDRDGNLESPVRLVADHDSVLVLDVTHKNAVSAFDREGRFIGARFPELHNASAVSIALGRATAAFGQADARTRPGRTVVSIRDRSGQELGSGCAAADGYAQSELRHGMLAHFVARFVAIRGNRIYCAQAITPVVSILDLTGKTVDYLTVAPPYYMPPTADIGETQNQKTMSEFQSKWTALQDFTVTQTGFFSIYSRYDLTSGAFIYRTFACDFGTRPSNCRVSVVPGRPIRFVSPDTVYSIISDRDGAVTLHAFQIVR